MVALIMTQTNNRIFDELAKLMTDAAGAAQGMRREVETFFKSQGERVLREMDVVSREEFEATKAMAVKAREENEALAARLAALEAELAALRSGRRADCDAVTRSLPDASRCDRLSHSFAPDLHRLCSMSL